MFNCDNSHNMLMQPVTRVANNVFYFIVFVNIFIIFCYLKDQILLVLSLVNILMYICMTLNFFYFNGFETYLVTSMENTLFLRKYKEFVYLI